MLLLTSRDGQAHVVEGLQAGANDYVRKPFDRAELEARVQVGIHVVRLQQELKHRVFELEVALASVKQLQGLLPICSYCMRIRDDRDSWQGMERYISSHTEAQFSHGICPECMEKVIAPQLRTLEAARTPTGHGNPAA